MLLAGGVAMGLARNPKSQRYILKATHRNLKEVDRRYLVRIIKEFKNDRLIDYREKKNGQTEIIISEKGKRKILEFNIDRIRIKKPIRWDGKWRIVMFDVPEKKRSERNVLRNKLKEIGFQEIQKSVFVHPYPCFNEIDFIVEYFKIRGFVRRGELSSLSNEEELKLKFRLF